MSRIRNRKSTNTIQENSEQGLTKFLSKLTSLYVNLPIEKVVRSSRKSHFALFSIIEIQKCYYLFHPKVSVLGTFSNLISCSWLGECPRCPP